MKKISVKKGEILQRKGELNSKVYKVRSGLLRSYSLDEQGKEHIFLFAPEDWIIADSSAKDVPSELYIDALEDTECDVINRYENLALDPLKLMKRMAVLQNRVTMLMSASAIDRYDHFLRTYPKIVQRVSQKMIASYLGITPEALSRVKKESHRKR
ncbi:MAG: Crp/Fnr family transcriptional regulator [Flavobacteriales bacterium]|jgi:CRP-like cAMP-binding protein